MVGHGARIAILAFGIAQGNEFATRFAEAVVFSTFVAIVAEIDVVAFDLQGLVNVIVTVVVKAVASLLCRGGGVARGQPIFGADPLAVTTTEFITGVAGRPEGEFDRFCCARTDPSIRDALQCVDTIDCDCRQARKPPGAVVVFGATATAVEAFRTVVDTNVIGSTYSFAAVG